MHTFDDGQLTMSFVEARPDIFYVATYGDATLQRIDLRGWTPGAPVSPIKVLDFEPPAGPNGSCLLAPGVMLFADCVEGLIWRVDLSDDGLRATARVWLQHDTMASGGDAHPQVRWSATMQVPFPGINGLRYGPKTKFVYYSCSSQELFMRVAVDLATLEPIGAPEHLADVPSVDDFCLDETAGVAYLTRHPDHIVERVPLEPDNSALRAIVAGDPFTEKLIGPTSVDWGRGPKDYGHVGYVTTDGGVVELPPDGIRRPARLMRLEFAVENGPPR
jgi:hypothetical protein